MMACLGLGLVALFAALCLGIGVAASQNAIGIVLAEGVSLDLLLTAGAAVCAFCIGLFCLVSLYQPSALPQGVLLHRNAVPSLHALIERVGKHFGGYRIDAVLMTDGMNAAVVQRPRWGLLGPMQTYLLLGLPLTHSVSDRQLAGVLAHEFAHLNRQRQGLGAWGCHVRAWWFRVLDRLVESLPDLPGRWLDRVSTPSLHGAMRLARLEEIEADQVAAAVAGRSLIAEVLVEVAIKERFLVDDYWPKVMGQCERMPKPSIRPYREMGLGMAAGFRRASSSLDLDMKADMAISEVGDNPVDGLGDFHPPLHERLYRLGVSDIYLPGGEPSVAETHLTALLPSLSLALDRDWWACARAHWRRHYRSCRKPGNC